MAERVFSARVHMDRPPETVFRWVSDYRNVPRVLEGVTRWRPVDQQTTGEGARFDVKMEALGLPLENVLVLNTWQEPRAIAWRSESGIIPQRGGWLFRRRGDGTDVVLEIAYTPPGGAVGGILASTVDSTVRRRLERALEGMKEILEADAA
jgi:uncharacterized membrane protein